MKVYILFKGWMEDTDFGYSYNTATQGVFSSMEKAQEAKRKAEEEQEKEKAKRKPWDNDEYDDDPSYYIEEHDVI